MYYAKFCNLEKCDKNKVYTVTNFLSTLNSIKTLFDDEVDDLAIFELS